MRPPRVSVNIAVKDRRDLLAACLDGLTQQSFTDFEIIVVDNGSTDGTPEMVQARAASMPMRLLRHDGSLGAARNAGVAASRGDIVAFVDSDCVPTPDWLTRGVAAFDEERVATVQGQTLPDPSATPGPWPATQQLTEFTGRYEACNLFYRRDVLVRAGGFDESIGFFGEDSMAGWAVRRLGYEERFEAGAVVHHAVTHPGIRWHWRRGLRYGHWNALVRRHPEMRAMLWHRVFLRPASARTLGALAGVGVLTVGLALRRRSPVLLGLFLLAPFVAANFKRSAKETVAAAGFDLAVEVGLVWGSIRERTVVL